MDFKIFFATFTTIFIAELGDKTQFAAMTASAESDSRISVLMGVVLALAVAGTLGVLFGAVLGKLIDPVKMKYIAGSAFILMGFWTILK